MYSKRYKKLPKKTKFLPANSIEKLITEIKKNCTTKFDESIDLSLQINNKQKKNEINLRTIVNLPGGSGKKIKVAVVCEESKAKIAKDAGADITDDIQKAVEDTKSGQAEIRNDKDGNIGLSIGKKSFSDDNLIKNYNAIIETLDKEKTNIVIKGNLVKSAFLTSTMGVSYKLKLTKNI